MIGARSVSNVTQAQKLLWTPMMVLLGDVVRVKARFNPFRDSDNLDAR
jgi:hypothetical protein